MNYLFSEVHFGHFNIIYEMGEIHSIEAIILQEIHSHYRYVSVLWIFSQWLVLGLCPSKTQLIWLMDGPSGHSNAASRS